LATGERGRGPGASAADGDAQFGHVALGQPAAVAGVEHLGDAGEQGLARVALKRAVARVRRDGSQVCQVGEVAEDLRRIARSDAVVELRDLVEGLAQLAGMRVVASYLSGR
jgi:hypothetical protein